jgi:exopolysaccharide biosynthesis polyprenyl glycosylphosphotransferase
MKSIAGVPSPSQSTVVKSYRGALTQWKTSASADASPRKSVPTSLWRVLWFVADILVWALASAFVLVLLKFFSTGSVFPNWNVVTIPLGVLLFSLWMVGAYDRDSDFASLRFASEFLIAGLLATLIGAGASALFGSYGQGTQTSRFFLLATPLFSAIGCLAVRRLAWAISDHETADQRIIVVGTTEEAKRLEATLAITSRPHRVVALPADQAIDGGLESLLRSPLLGTEETETTGRDTVVIAPSAAQQLSALSPFLVALHASTVPVYTWSAYWSQRVKTLDPGIDTPEWFFEKDFRLGESSAYSHLKRLTDLVVGTLALFLSLPVLLVTVIAIRLDSPGAAIFRQKRVGLRGREFTIYKFRTMTLNSELAGSTTTKGDARITRLGNFLRKVRIDEIPQLINVIKGDMSIVGPRPEWTVCVANYEDQLPGYHLRHLVKPGITGWAQVNYPYGEGVEDARNKLSFDLFYVAHSSLILDCSIILKTIYVLIGRIGGR